LFFISLSFASGDFSFVWHNTFVSSMVAVVAGRWWAGLDSAHHYLIYVSLVFFVAVLPKHVSCLLLTDIGYVVALRGLLW